MITTNPYPCWTTVARFEADGGYSHWDTEDQALNVIIRQFTEDTTQPGELPGRFTACCLMVHCDGPDCGEPLYDREWELLIHFDTYPEVLEHLADDARAEAATRHSRFPYLGWTMTPDGRTFCPGCREEGQVPAPPLTAAEQAAAGQQVLV